VPVLWLGAQAGSRKCDDPTGPQWALVKVPRSITAAPVAVVTPSPALQGETMSVSKGKSRAPGALQQALVSEEERNKENFTPPAAAREGIEPATGTGQMPPGCVLALQRRAGTCEMKVAEEKATETLFCL
jgi:hypothetical protein